MGQRGEHHRSRTLLIGRHDASAGLVAFWNQEREAEAHQERDHGYAREQAAMFPEQRGTDSPVLRRLLIVLEGSDDRCRDHGSETVWIRHIAYRDATDAVMAMDEASCAVVNKFFHSSEAPMIF
jgi:hypothetical protein